MDQLRSNNKVILILDTTKNITVKNLKTLTFSRGMELGWQGFKVFAIVTERWSNMLRFFLYIKVSIRKEYVKQWNVNPYICYTTTYELYILI